MANRRNVKHILTMNKAVAAMRQEQKIKMQQQGAQQMINKSSGRGNQMKDFSESLGIAIGVMISIAISLTVLMGIIKIMLWCWS